jgi:MFS superfamily sulfate permease-like transporter
MRLPAKSDLISSAVVFIVALPLSLGIAMASGVPASAGLVSAILGGLVAGTLAGAPLAVTGPAAGLAALVLEIARVHGLEGVAVATLIAGLLQVGLGLARAGRLVELVPKPVLEGMLTAIGALILLGQVHVLIGQPVPQSLLAGLQALPANLGRTLASGPPAMLPILACGLLALGIQLAWPKLLPRLAWFPAALPAVVIATLVSLVWEMPRVAIAPVFRAMGESLFTFGGLAWISRVLDLLPMGVALAAVASAESLLSARAIDSLARARNPGAPSSDLNRELVAQGVTNSLAGILGGIPCTGVIVRSAVNVNAGATTRWSTILHGAWIALFVGLAPFVLTRIPLTALASVLILTGLKLMNLPRIAYELRHAPREAAIWMGTSLVIVSTDLLKGLTISLAFVALLNAREALARLRLRLG